MAALPGNLDGTRVLDLTREPGFFAGKLLGDLGADVVKIEPPAGDPARRRPPFWGDATDPERAIVWLALNTSKRGITLDLERPRGRDLFLDLAARADVVLETAPIRGLGWQDLRARNRRLVHCAITPFGETGPRAGWRGSDLTVSAASGNLYSTGDPDRAPVRCTLPVSYYHGGTAAMYAMTGNRGSRAGAFMRQEKSVAREIWPCKDGFVSFALRGGAARIPGLAAMVRWMGEHGMASPKLQAIDWKGYNHNLLTQAEVDELSREFGAFFMTKTMSELYRAACERNLMLAPINTAREITASAQLASRGFFVDVDDAGRGRLRYPGAFARSTATPIGIRRPAPRLGEHTAEVLGELGLGAGELERLRAEGVV